MGDTEENLYARYNNLVSMRLRRALEQRGLRQRDVLAMAENRNLLLRQSALSKLLSGKMRSIPTLEAATLCKLLELDLNEVLSPDGTDTVTLPAAPHAAAGVDGAEFITDPRNRKMRPYLGQFYTWFFPTKDTETRLLKGTLIFEPSGDKKRTLASFSFKTGKKHRDGTDIVKQYHGELRLSPLMSAAYCILQNDEIGELSFLMFRYIGILYESLPCSVALVLTSSAGPTRMPTAHRMLISSTEIPDERMEVLKGQLYMNEPEILISEKGMEQFMKDPRVKPAFIEYFKGQEGSLFAGVTPTRYYRINESAIRDAFLEDETAKLDALHVIRRYSVSPRNHKLGRCDELVAKSLAEDEEARARKAAAQQEAEGNF